VQVSASTQQVIFTAEKSVSDLLSQVLGAEGKTTLTQAHAVVVADISAMPAMISRLLAIPKLRELPFSMALVRDASTVADLPRRKGAATVLTLDKGQVTQVQYLQSEAELRQALAITP
jgi:NADPH-dependent ferric siderophore reductase